MVTRSYWAHVEGAGFHAHQSRAGGSLELRLSLTLLPILFPLVGRTHSHTFKLVSFLKSNLASHHLGHGQPDIPHGYAHSEYLQQLSSMSPTILDYICRWHGYSLATKLCGLNDQILKRHLSQLLLAPFRPLILFL